MCSALVTPGMALAQGSVVPGAPVHELTPVQVEGQAHNEGYQATTSASRKMLAPLLDTARTVTIISEQLMRDRAATSLVDVLRTAPGITFSAGEGGTPVGDRPFIRGYEASTDMMVYVTSDVSRTRHSIWT